ncbi:uncharacterized protein A4U43_C09F10010, partial [Asparagus officinalis]
NPTDCRSSLLAFLLILMEPSPAAKLAAQSSKPRLFTGSSSYLDEDLDIIELSGPSSSSWNTNNQKRKRTQ